MVPRDPKRDDVFDLHSGKQPLNVLADEVLEENEMVSLHVFIDRNKPWQDGRDFDEGVSLWHLDSARLLENGHEIEAKVGEERKRMPRVDGQRRQNGEDLELKVFFEPLPLFLVELVDAVGHDPHLLESRQHLFQNASVLFSNERAYFVCDFVELLPDRSAACVDAIHTLR